MLILRLETRKNLEELLSETCQDDSNEEEAFEWQDVNADIFSIIITACEKLDKVDGFVFKISGFGRDWPVEIYPDLSCVVEQLSEAIDAIRQKKYPFDLELYEQGINKTITFNKKNDDGFIEVKCHDFIPQKGEHYRKAWKPDPDTILVEEKKILSQLLDLKFSFIQAVQKVCPDLAAEDLFIEWCES
ncbi:hypothetical protein [Baaleninema simplex]|uniref:hypothetical protein n=1 Tax=Baaleninema simplex TaxID=2862350 RepID=UPI0003632FA3|nr:hypothetical protein [Baaleninema simplex]